MMIVCQPKRQLGVASGRIVKCGLHDAIRGGLRSGQMKQMKPAKRHPAMETVYRDLKWTEITVARRWTPDASDCGGGVVTTWTISTTQNWIKRRARPWPARSS